MTDDVRTDLLDRLNRRAVDEGWGVLVYLHGGTPSATTADARRAYSFAWGLLDKPFREGLRKQCASQCKTRLPQINVK